MKAVAAFLIFLVMLAACGQTGDLYWPVEEEEETVVDEDEDAG